MSRHLNLSTNMGLSPQTGYGRMVLGLAKGLRAVGIDLLLFPDRDVPTLVIGHTPAFEADHVLGTRRWGFVMLESDRPAPGFVATINTHCERILVPVPPLAEIFAEHGVTVPIHVVPLGVDLFPVEPLPHRRGETVTFLTYSYGETRKGADVAVQAFVSAFGSDPGVRLVVKAREGYQLGWLSQVDHPSITLVGGAQREADWRALLQAADCFVYPSRAEGWGMPPRDATVAGVPTIATQWLGLHDVEAWGLPLPVAHLRPNDFHANPFNDDDGRWAEPDLDALVELLRWVRDHPAEAEAVAQRGRAHLLAGFGWEHVGARIATLLDDVSRARAATPTREGGA